MRLYRFRIVNPPSELIALCEHDCPNDTAAAAKARTLCDGHNVEVWQGNRWVATIKEYSAKVGRTISPLATVQEPQSSSAAGLVQTTA